MRKSFTAFAFLLILAADTGVQAQPLWWPVVPLGDVYPAQVLGHSGRTRNLPNFQSFTGLSTGRMGDSDGAIGVRFSGISAGDQIRIEFEETRLSASSTYEVTVLSDRDVEIYPSINWLADELRQLDHPQTVGFNISVSINGAEPQHQSHQVRVRSINECPLIYVTGEDSFEDLRELFTAYVDEFHPMLATLRREALDTGIVDAFIGYQGNAEDVQKQVYALWNVLQRRGVQYSSIGDATLPATGSTFSQHIRRVGETLATSEANCIDGATLYASFLRAVGIDSFIILVPGHAYLGYFLEPASTEQGDRAATFLETTMIGNEDLRNIPEARSNELLSPSDLTMLQDAMTRSRESFEEATDVATENFAIHQPHLAASETFYQLIDIEEARNNGVSPIGEVVP